MPFVRRDCPHERDRWPGECRRPRQNGPDDTEESAMTTETETALNDRTAIIAADFQAAPLDETSRERLAAAGLEPRVVPVDDAEAFAPWLQVVARGFLD